jgi:DNA-binding transcriptional ArsR family regulator
MEVCEPCAPSEKRLPSFHGLLDCVFSERKQGYANFFTKKADTLNLEDIFCSKTRMRILKMLFKLGQLNTSDLAHELRANYATTLSHLMFLKKREVVIERLSSKTRFFRLTKTLKAQAVMKLLVEWEQ